MELKQWSDRIWYSMYEVERDRPCLGYIRGDDWSIAVDAGHSAEHTQEFYHALQKADLPLPRLTVITHWHWDHAFGMHRITGLSVANKRTNEHLIRFRERVNAEGEGMFLGLDPSISKEYECGQSVVIVPADIVFDQELWLDPGGCSVQLLTCVSPHTNDSTLIFVPEEKMLFVGDCISGTFPDWIRDPYKTRDLMETIKSIDADFCLGGHWDVFSKEELIQALEEEAI